MVVAAVVVLAAWLSVACGGSLDKPAPPAPTKDFLTVPFRTSIPWLTALPTGYRTEVVLEGLDMPTSLAATPDGRLLVTEQTTGRVRVVRDGRLRDERWLEFPVYFADGF